MQWMLFLLAFTLPSLAQDDRRVGNGGDTFRTQFEEYQEVLVKVMDHLSLAQLQRLSPRPINAQQFAAWKNALKTLKFLFSERNLVDEAGDGLPKAALALEATMEVEVSRPYLRKNSVGPIEGLVLTFHESGHLGVPNYFSHKELDQIGLALIRMVRKNPGRFGVNIAAFADPRGSGERGSLTALIKHGTVFKIHGEISFSLAMDEYQHQNLAFQDGVLYRQLDYVDWSRPFCLIIYIRGDVSDRFTPYQMGPNEEWIFEGNWRPQVRDTHPAYDTIFLPRSSLYYFNRLQVISKSGRSSMLMECGEVGPKENPADPLHYLSEQDFYHAVGTYFSVPTAANGKKLP